MSRKVFLFIVAIAVFSCDNEENKEEVTTTVDSLSSSLADSLYVAEPAEDAINEDTVAVDKVAFIFANASKNEFLKTDTSGYITKDSNGIRKEGLRWFFKLTGGNEKNILTNDTSSTGDAYQRYSFVGDISAINHWLFLGTYYESMDYILINKTNGKQTSLIGYPSISPNGQLVLAGASDLMAGFDDNGLQLLRYKDGNIIEMANVQLQTRGPYDIRWINQNTAIVEENYLVADGEAIRYSRIYLQVKN